MVPPIDSPGVRPPGKVGPSPSQKSPPCSELASLRIFPPPFFCGRGPSSDNSQGWAPCFTPPMKTPGVRTPRKVPPSPPVAASAHPGQAIEQTGESESSLEQIPRARGLAGVYSRGRRLGIVPPSHAPGLLAPSSRLPRAFPSPPAVPSALRPAGRAPKSPLPANWCLTPASMGREAPPAPPSPRG